ncbi:hypothetical protein SAMN02799624_05427 [Paenibacillus sp. UNC496MF]|uniref:hypothetical protein n=1 Tax=Paenibacillus sp. UNC496MF TaxID=1502753 RepID=UPI0008F2CC88|nr:hypothetical protein [Paenibacillus sp. UNC496MF]SFJ65967.1 hypothetical protein SAMN02799624_05427 [Paenibacillus sp. UNC496MF]
MDVISLGKGTQAVNKITDLDTNVIALQAEGRFPTVDARLDWLAGQANQIKQTTAVALQLEQGTFVNTELVNGKLQLKKLGVDSYFPSGTWESNVTDLGKGWIETGAVSMSGSVVSWEVATSANGQTFSEYAALKLDSPPEARWVKFKATLTNPAGPTDPVSLDFNQGDAQNTFVLDEYAEANGTLHLKTSYAPDVDNEGALEASNLFSVTLNKVTFKSIEKVSVM